MSVPADALLTPPGLPPGPGVTPTQAMGTAPPAGFDSARLGPGIFDASSWESDDSDQQHGEALPAIVVEARELVLRLRRASWCAEALPEAARRVAARALAETRAALAAGLAADTALL